MKGVIIPDKKLLKAKGYDKLEYIYSRNPIVNSSVRDVTLSLFDISRPDHFEVICSNQTLTPIFYELVSDHPIEGTFGNLYHGLRDFFTEIFRHLIVYGKVFAFVDYIQEQNTQVWKIRRIRLLPIETIKIRRKWGKITGFSQQYSKGSSNTEKTDFLNDEVFFVEWKFSNEGSSGVSPLLPLIPLAQKHLEFLNLMSLQMFAIANPQDRSYRVEKARYASFEKEKQLNDINDLTIRETIGTWSDAPMTDYYSTYRFAKCRKKIALVREYLVEQFNLQIVHELSKKNGLTEPANIRLKGYLTSTQLTDLLNQYERLEISQEIFLKRLLNDMHAT
jgi:hypothetical protein